MKNHTLPEFRKVVNKVHVMLRPLCSKEHKYALTSRSHVSSAVVEHIINWREICIPDSHLNLHQRSILEFWQICTLYTAAASLHKQRPSTASNSLSYISLSIPTPPSIMPECTCTALAAEHFFVCMSVKPRIICKLCYFGMDSRDPTLALDINSILSYAWSFGLSFVAYPMNVQP